MRQMVILSKHLIVEFSIDDISENRREEITTTIAKDAKRGVRLVTFNFDKIDTPFESSMIGLILGLCKFLVEKDITVRMEKLCEEAIGSLTVAGFHHFAQEHCIEMKTK